MSTHLQECKVQNHSLAIVLERQLVARNELVPAHQQLPGLCCGAWPGPPRLLEPSAEGGVLMQQQGQQSHGVCHADAHLATIFGRQSDGVLHLLEAAAICMLQLTPRNDILLT